MGFLRQASIAALLGAAATAATVAAADEAPVVSVKNGSYQGVYQPTYKQDMFLGMPFAQQPVGDLRFRNPVSLNATWSGLKNATDFGPACYGYGSDQDALGFTYAEDCLTLDVIRPSGISEGADLPVAVWIYGGGFYEGASRYPMYNLTYIVEQSTEMGKPFIAVSINYRVNYFGFMWGTEVQKAGVANLGLKDQRLALHWVQENIGFFGGNPEQVTIWGESAGAKAVGYQLIAYGGRDDGLFHAAIMESGCSADGGPLQGNAPAAYTNASLWDTYYTNITDSTNCTSAEDTLDCLRQVPVETLWEVFAASIEDSLGDSPVSASIYPMVDGDFVQAIGTEMLANGDFAHVPILHGTNHDEGTTYTFTGINTDEEFQSLLIEDGRTEEEAAILMELYPDILEIGIPATLDSRPSPNSTYGAQYKRASAYGGDKYMHAPRRFLSQTWAANNLSAYAYEWNVLVNGDSAYYGATHFEEVAFVFHNINGTGYVDAGYSNPFENEPESYKQLATMMSRMWISFIVDQTPNDNGVTYLEWPEYSTHDAEIIVFDANTTALVHLQPDVYRAEAINYLHELYHTN